ncbi:hypothetical protein [Virgibacillus sp. DJP39]|uniref:hypothetical protein n=1 Tax=Virgibacillus sp. DJP39 TaxID=3409790 RepID=UPI003BB623B2
MQPALYFIFLVIFMLSIIVIAKTFYNRKVIPCMTGMMIAMTMGMSVGLIFGVIFGILFSDNLFISTMSGMVVGMATGFLYGIPVSVIAVLDGFLAGIMGGLMGAMLGKMIALEYRDAVIKIIFIIFFATLLILLHMIHNHVKGNEKSFFNHPFLLVVLFGLIFVVFHQLGPIFN